MRASARTAAERVCANGGSRTPTGPRLKRVPPANWATFAYGARGSTRTVRSEAKYSESHAPAKPECAKRIVNSPSSACKADVLTRERAPHGSARQDVFLPRRPEKVALFFVWAQSRHTPRVSASRQSSKTSGSGRLMPRASEIPHPERCSSSSKQWEHPFRRG
jgi:hypothetical protein